jgi:Tfp pilus assembly protein PilV
MKPVFNNQNSQKGVTLIEQMIVVIFISLGILVWIFVFKTSTQGTYVTRDNLKAQNLALSKMEDLRSMALSSSYAGSWHLITKTALAQQYSQLQSVTLDSRVYNWRVQMYYLMGASHTAAMQITTVATDANMISMTAEVFWQDVLAPQQLKALTLTSYITNFR